MSKRLRVTLALALIVGLTFGAAYAEVQNVKVSGDILASGVARRHFNLEDAREGDKSFLQQNFLMSQVRARIDADLTDNVATTVRLINERIWNGQNDSGVANTNNGNIDIDLAFVTLKEFLYSPLTLTVGRQEIKFGNGLIIGNAKVAGTSSSIPTDLTLRKSFDAIRANLNYDPLVVDVVYAQVQQATSATRNTISLSGVNATYAVNNRVDVSAYAWLKRDHTIADARSDEVATIGTLIALNPVDYLDISLEGAYQFGKNRATANGAATAQRHKAFAFQAMVDYTFAKAKTTPKIGASFTHLSGNTTGNTRNRGWDPMFYDQKLNNIVYTLIPFSNLNALNLRGSMKPTEDVTVGIVYGYYDVAKRTSNTFTVPNTYDNGTAYYAGAAYKAETHIGDAVDISATYDYTEDVQFGITGGYFRPGDALNVNGKAAQQLIGSMKVTF